MTDDLPERLEHMTPEVRAILDSYMSRKAMAALDAGQGVVIYPETLNSLLKPLTEAASLIQRLEGEKTEAHRLLDRLEQARTEGDGPDEETLNLAGRILNLACDHKAAEQALSASQKEVERLIGWRDQNLRQLIAIRMVRPTHDDLCRLSVIFGRSSDLRTDQDIRINEWLKAQIADASALQTGGKEHG